MYTGKRYSFVRTLQWSMRSIIVFVIYDTAIVLAHSVFHLEWLHLPWQPISVIGIAVAFYLGFKNNASYDRLWEARKIWGGIVNASRSFTVMARDVVNNDAAERQRSSDELYSISQSLVYRHCAWLRALALEMRKPKSWEHYAEHNETFRKQLGLDFEIDKFEEIKPYLSSEEYDYILRKGNKSSHLLSMQSKTLIKLRQEGIVEHFRHLEMQNLITEFYTLQGKSERIKNFPFPRQYASVNYFFVVIFIILLPLGMLNIFHNHDNEMYTLFAIPFSIIASWVFWIMEMIGDYSENPFEGLHNDVPISSIARGIEIDIRQMLDETDLPGPVELRTQFEIMV